MRRKNQEKEPEVIDIPAVTSSTALVPATTDAITLTRVEMDTQIATAKQFPRDLALYERNAMHIVESHLAMSRDPSEGLFYSLTRGGKVIEGPNVRLAEIIQHSFGNSRAGARVVEEGEKFVTAEGIFHDLESNTAIRMFVKRRITDRDGRRYNEDMIGVTGNAAAAIAYRNSVLKGIPKALWWNLYLRTRKVAGGTTKPEISERLKKALATCKKYNIPEANLCARLGVSKVSDIGTEELATFVGILTAVAHKETSLDREFKLKVERTTSDVKSSAPNPDSAISANQVLDVNTLVGDWHLGSNDVKLAMTACGHRGELTALPQKKMPQFMKELEKRKK
jgi:hypothetical protein